MVGFAGNPSEDFLNGYILTTILTCGGMVLNSTLIYATIRYLKLTKVEN